MTENFAVCFVVDHQGGRLARTALGLAAEARRLAASVGGETCAFLAGRDVGRLAAAIPADAVVLASHPDLEDAPDLLVAVLERAVRTCSPRILLLAATPRQGEVAARLASRLGVAAVPHALRVDVDAQGGVQVLRNVYGGRASCLIHMRGSLPHIVTVVPESLPAPRQAAGRPQVLPVALPSPAQKRCQELVDVQRLRATDLALEQASVVVAGGRGLGGPEGFRWLNRLAGLLGAALAASRPAVDSGWAPRSSQIGSSGKTVSPRLYIACGISGASQHLVGMRRSEHVVVINIDAHAPLSQLADLVLVGDANAVIPECVRRLQEMGGEVPGDAVPALSVAERAGARQEPVRVMVCLSMCHDPDVGAIDLGHSPLAGRQLVANPDDLGALEWALQLKERAPESEVYAVALGAAEAEEALRLALAMGADGAVRIQAGDGGAPPDTLATARALAAAARSLRADVVFCGRRNSDGGTGQTPLQLGEELGWASVSNVLDFAVDSHFVWTASLDEMQRRLTHRTALPALLTVAAGANKPRYPTLRSRVRARSIPIRLLERAELGLAPKALDPQLQVLSLGPAKPVVPSMVGATAGLSPEQRLQQLMGGGGSDAGAARVVQGSPQYLAERLISFLVEKGFLPFPVEGARNP